MVLKDEHFDALKRFCAYVKENPRQIKPASDRVAYVLPKDYGYGFRGPNDKIWGFWGADNLTNKVCNDINSLLATYNERLDIIYDRGLSPGNSAGYSRLFFWNESIPSTSSGSNSISSTVPNYSTPNETENMISKNEKSINDYFLLIVLGAVIAAIAVPAYFLRKQQFQITFDITGIGTDYNGPTLFVDGISYDKFGATFWWEKGSRHTYEFKQKIFIKKSNYSKQYILSSISGEQLEKGSLTVAGSTNVVGNYKSLFAK